MLILLIFSKWLYPIQAEKRAALGNAWFVSSRKLLTMPIRNFQEIETLNPKITAIVDKRFNINQSDFKYDPMSKNKIDIENYKPNHLVYIIDKPSKSNQLLLSQKFIMTKAGMHTLMEKLYLMFVQTIF